MDILQFRGMSRVLEYVHRWVEGKFYGVLNQLFQENGLDAASARLRMIQVSYYAINIECINLENLMHVSPNRHALLMYASRSHLPSSPLDPSHLIQQAMIYQDRQLLHSSPRSMWLHRQESHCISITLMHTTLPHSVDS